MNRTQQEIKQRFDEANDMFGTQHGDLISYMTFETAKEFLKEDYVKQIEGGSEKWEQRTDPKKEILDYLSFAYDKADGERGISAGRSMLHFRTWVWLDDKDFYAEIESLINNYTNYGIPALDKISEHYGYSRN